MVRTISDERVPERGELVSMIRSARMVTAVSTAAAMAIGVAACSGKTPGQALPTGVSGGTTTTTLQTTISRGNEALDRVDPCALLNAAELGQFGADPGIRKGSAQSARACDWRVPGNGGFQIVLRNSESLGEIVVQGGKVADHKVGNRQGKILRDNVITESCMVSFALTNWSRVDVIASARDTENACDYSVRVATQIEPRLPEGG
jgi:hypothetical protein